MSPEQNVISASKEDLKSYQNLYWKGLNKLEENSAFKEAVVKRFLDNPLDDGLSEWPETVTFQEDGVNYSVYLKKSRFEDRLAIQIGDSEFFEIMQIRLWYSKSNSLERGDLSGGSMLYMKMEYKGKSEFQMDNAEASEKITKLIRLL